MINLEEFSETLDQISAGITDLIVIRAEYFATWPTEERVDEINRYKGFFAPARSAMQQAMLLTPARIVDKDKRTASFPDLIEAIRRDPKLLLHADYELLDKLELRIGAVEETIEKLTTVRNKTLAHKDRAGDIPKVTKAELDKLITELIEIYSQLSSATDQSVTSWQMIKTVAERDSALSLDDALIGFDDRQQRYEKILEETKQYEAPNENE